MKKIILSTLIAFMVTCAFGSAKRPNVVGTYGITNGNPWGIELVIHHDNTFTYKDLSNPNKQIEVAGTWVKKRNQVVLKSNSEASFHDTWKISKDGTRAKSRKGMTFYALCRM